MARFKNKRRKYSRKPLAAAAERRSGHRSRGKLPGPLKQLEVDIRNIMLPYTAFKLKEKKRNNHKDFLNVAAPMGVTHFLMLSNLKSIPHLQVARMPQGPTLTFEIREYAVAADIAWAQIRQGAQKTSSITLLCCFI